MSADIVTATHKQVTHTMQTEHENFMSMLMSASSSGASVEHLAKLMELKEKHERREAEKAFNIDFADMSAEIPRVPRNGVVSLKRDGKDLGSYNFARFEDMDITLDSGPGRSNNQARGGSVSFGRRYVYEMLLNIVREGADTDDNSDFIAPDTAKQIEELLTETGADRANFLAVYGAESVEVLPASCGLAALNMLAKKRKPKS